MLDNLTLFLSIVEKGGLSAAGRELGLSPTTVSERLAALETYYGATLLTRTTRAISLTDEGRLLIDGARRLLAEADDLESRIKLGVEKVSGPIRISAPSDLGRARISPLINSFLIEHPEVSIDLTLTDGTLDLVGQGLDLGVRYGALPDSSLKVHKLADNRRVICASPGYLAANAAPKKPDDLAHHNCLVMRSGVILNREWPFTVKGKTVKVIVGGNRITNDGGLVREWCLNGLGIARKSLWDIKSELESGALVEVLPKNATPPTPLQIVYPQAQTMPKRVRLLIEHFENEFRKLRS